MNNKLNHSEIIDSRYLFWGHEYLEGVISHEEREALCDAELFDWLSSLYWGEGIAMNYSLKMSEISPNKDKWLEVYRDEHRHQTLIGNWFVERGLSPLPKNKFINYAFKMVDKIDSSMTEELLVESMYSTQVLFEELFHSLLKLRMKHVRDRSLRSIFYQIFIDESEHLTKARTEIQELGCKPKKTYEVLEENKSRLFPREVAKGILSEVKISSLKGLEEMIVTETLENAKSNNHLYRPIPILHQFLKIPDYNCVACSPKRHDGLLLEPKFNEVLGLVEDTYIFPKRCEGFNSVVHGGFIGMVLDEMMVYSGILTQNLLPLTRNMSVTFKRPVMVGIQYKLESQVIATEGQIISCKASIKDLNGVIYAESEGKLYVPTRVQAPIILGRLAQHEIVQGMLL